MGADEKKPVEPVVTEKQGNKKLFEVVCTYRFDGGEYNSEFNDFVLAENKEEAEEIFKKLSEKYYDIIHEDDCFTLVYTELKAKEVEPLNG